MSEIDVYVDGSWKTSRPEYSGWAYVILKPDLPRAGQIIYEDSGLVLAKSRQIDGELVSTLKALIKVKSMRKISKVNLYYDYMGIEKWATGEWKASSEIARIYVETLNGELKEVIKKVNFVKLKSHTGEHFWNDYIDLKAKEALDFSTT